MLLKSGIVNAYRSTTDLLAVQDEIVVLSSDSFNLAVFQVVHVLGHGCCERVMRAGPSTVRLELLVGVCVREQRELSDPQEMWLIRQSDMTIAREAVHDLRSQPSKMREPALCNLLALAQPHDISGLHTAGSTGLWSQLEWPREHRIVRPSQHVLLCNLDVFHLSRSAYMLERSTHVVVFEKELSWIQVLRLRCRRDHELDDGRILVHQQPVEVFIWQRWVIGDREGLPAQCEL
jgi:hypothetical protein